MKNPYPPFVRRVMRRLLPNGVYQQYFGRPETVSLHWWEQLCARVPQGQVILDIGAFDGEFALLAARHASAPIYAFEPNPHSAQRLQAACAGKNIEVLAIAIAAENGTLPFLCSAQKSHLVEPGQSSESAAEIVQVPARTLDAWMGEKNVTPYVVKIDVEGAEAGILKSAPRLLNEVQPIILCEVLSDAAGAAVAQSLPAHYRFYHVDERKGLSRQNTITRRLWRNKNWLLVPESKTSELSLPA